MMPFFFNRIGLERVGVVGLDLDGCGLIWRLWIVGPEVGMLLGWPAGAGVAFLCKNKKEEGPVGASPLAALIPKSISF